MRKGGARIGKPAPGASTISWGIGIGAIAVELALAIGVAIDPQPSELDRAIIIALHGAGPRWLHSAMLNLTALGSGALLTVFTAAAIGFLCAGKRWLAALLVLGTTVSGALMVDWLKNVIARPRPDLVNHLVQVSSYSFPSAHAANSATVYLTIALLLAQTTTRRAERVTIFALTILLIGAIGISRIYLGVHWPSDVLAGWAFGTLWALAWWWLGGAIRAKAAAGRP